MPGWWFTVESDTSRHMMHQFKAAIEDALSSAHDVRADMRARSAKQRFPVAQWVEDLEILQSASIRIHEKERRSSKVVQRQSGAGLEVLIPPSRNVSQERLSMYEAEDEDTIGPLPTQGESGSSAASGGLNRTLSLGTRAGPGHRPSRLRLLVPHDDGAEDENENMEVPISLEEAEAARQRQTTGILRDFNDLDNVVPRTMARLDEERGRSTRKVTPRISVMDPTPIDPRPMNLSRGGGSQTRSPSPTSGSASPDPGLGLFPLRSANASRSSLLSLDEVTHGRSDYNLQKIELNFTDKTGEYYNKFQSMLEKDLNAKTSESSLAIEDFLKESEKEWAGRYRNAKLGRSPLASRGPSPAPSRSGSSDSSRRSSMSHQDFHASTAYEPSNMEDEFLMKEGYVRPSILKRWLRTRVMDWPIYSIFLAIGQVRKERRSFALPIKRLNYPLTSILDHGRQLLPDCAHHGWHPRKRDTQDLYRQFDLSRRILGLVVRVPKAEATLRLVHSVCVVRAGIHYHWTGTIHPPRSWKRLGAQRGDCVVRHGVRKWFALFCFELWRRR